MNQREEVGKAGGMYSLNRMPRNQLITSGYSLNEDPLISISCYGALRASSGNAVAIAQIPANNRTLQAKNTIDTLSYAASLLNFKGTGFELLANNVETLH